MEADIEEIALDQDFSDVSEAIILNQIQLREMVKEVIDAVITSNMQKLRDIRQQIDD